VKCPCCDSEIDRDAIVHGNELWLADGRVIRGTVMIMQIMGDLLQNGRMKTNFGTNSNSVCVQVNRLRDVLREHGAPFLIQTDKKAGQYVLRRLTE
jgi:hypothetical protein